MSEPEVSRSNLPIPDPAHVGLTTYDAKDPDTAYPPIVPLRPPAGAPNVLVVLIDDTGFGSSSAFGGPCQTPTFDHHAVGIGISISVQMRRGCGQQRLSFAGGFRDVFCVMEKVGKIFVAHKMRVSPHFLTEPED